MAYESVQEMFGRMAAEFGSRVAIIRGNRQIHYGELEAESNRLANYLLESGVTRGTMVALFTHDPIQIITGILGVLKAGAVFVPLDPTFPTGRLLVMSGQVEPQWFVSEEKHLEKLSVLETSSGARVLCLDGPSYQEYRNINAPGLPVDPDAPCSIYFTSGSTGRPKAILGRLKGIDHFMRWEIGAVGAGPGTRVSQLASPAFDGFLKDVFVPLCSGGVVCAPESRDIILDAWSLADWLDVEQVEVLHCVPSLFRSLLNENLNNRYFESMKCVVMTGEPLYPADVKRWLDVFGDRVRLFNIYGTTETSLSKFVYEIKPEDVERPSIPVGKPIEGSSFMVIDSRGELCGLGAVGEIHIQTSFRSHGYYNAPELTREVFIQNPFSDDPADIVHKTGDYGRLLIGGDLEHLGRRDQQVQIRGVRVELGEIENLLRAHEAVADVAVIDREDADGNKFLVVFVTMANGGGTEPLRQYLSDKLPPTMLPSAFIELDQLPRTLNGKIDRKALPSLESTVQSEVENSKLTPIEEIVEGIWCEVLRVSSVTRNGNFFNLGGHSLLVTQVLARVREYLKVEVPIRSIFEAPTLQEFAQLIQEQVSHGRENELTTIVKVPREAEMPLSFAQERMWFFERLSSGTSAFNIALGVRFTGPLNVSALEQTFSEIIRRHEGLHTVFRESNNQPVQIIQPPARFRLPVVDLNSLAPEEREHAAARVAREETPRAFDLATGPLLRLTLLRMSSEEHIVICTMNHIIADRQSFEAVIAEMSQVYTAFGQGQPSPLAEVAVQYVDYAAWQRQWLQGEELEKRLAYWRKQLADASERLNLPLARPRPKVQQFGGSAHDLNLSAELTEALKDLGRREGLTLFMTMFSAYLLLLNQYTDDNDLVVGSVYANRERVEAEKVIGILANTLVLRVDLSETTTVKDVLRLVRQVCLDAYSYQLPPELLREDMLKHGEDRERLFDVWFQLDKPLKEQLDMNGLKTSWYEGKEVTRFELSLALGELEEGMIARLSYDDHIFSAQTTARMLEDYVDLLKLIAADPEKNLSTISLAPLATGAGASRQV
ncbi:MAG TPA: amino acid adenylation domain-containing protein [Pyrinomonadaceae bacterium]